MADRRYSPHGHARALRDLIVFAFYAGTRAAERGENAASLRDEANEHATNAVAAMRKRDALKEPTDG